MKVLLECFRRIFILILYTYEFLAQAPNVYKCMPLPQERLDLHFYYGRCHVVPWDRTIAVQTLNTACRRQYMRLNPKPKIKIPGVRGSRIEYSNIKCIVTFMEKNTAVVILPNLPDVRRCHPNYDLLVCTCSTPQSQPQIFGLIKIKANEVEGKTEWSYLVLNHLGDNNFQASSYWHIDKHPGVENYDDDY